MGAQHRTLSVKVFQKGFKGFGRNLAALGFAGLHGEHLAIHTFRLEIVRTCNGRMQWVPGPGQCFKGQKCVIGPGELRISGD